MKYLPIKNCFHCPHSDHSGAFTPGGARQLCRHNDTPGKDWPNKKTVDFMNEQMGYPDRKLVHNSRVRPDGGKIPKWCPL